MLKYLKVLVYIFPISLFLFLACGASQISQRGDSRRDYSYNNSQSQKSFAKDPAFSRFTVPTEIAVINISISAYGTSFKEVSNLIELNAEEIIKNVSREKGCSANIQDSVQITNGDLYDQQREINSNINYQSNLDLEILISFSEISTIKERMKQISKCLQKIHEIEFKKTEEVTEIAIYMSNVLPTIRNANGYRKQLLEHKFNTLQEIVDIKQQPLQFNASSTKCTSNGTVAIINRSLNEIELDIDFKCRLEGNTDWKQIQFTYKTD